MVKSERLVKFSLYGLCLVLSFFFFLVGCYAYDFCMGKCLRGLPFFYLFLACCHSLECGLKCVWVYTLGSFNAAMTTQSSSGTC